MPGFLYGLGSTSDAPKSGAAPKLGSTDVSGTIAQPSAVSAGGDPMSQLVQMRATAQAAAPDQASAVGGAGLLGNSTDYGVDNYTPTSGGGAGATPAAATKAVAGSPQQVLQTLAAQRGWTGDQWNALNNVENREAGYNLTAQNPTSSAYGMAQFINGPSEYAKYGGDSTTASGESTAMLNYIAMRYGTPAAAWGHEQQYGWY